MQWLAQWEYRTPDISLWRYEVIPTSKNHWLYIDMLQDVCHKIQETARLVNVPIIADGDTGYGSPMNVKRTVQCFAEAGAAGVMIEDQTWPKRKQQYHSIFSTVCVRLNIS